ncbi:MAG: hypothetical protein KME45_03435 [Stenomitos rutilans HA7619-LM2]|jgi:hypothetical protein|nr:hypothetical protein [Stenomitos rutilans HA7619-LM2]MBW4469438.1 hypothetical protein [Stenomitos rutilans HA7619-LM2]
MADFTQTMGARPSVTQIVSASDAITTNFAIDAPNKQWILSQTVNNGTVEKLTRRLLIKEGFNGSLKTTTITEYLFAGGATYVSSASPANSTAINATSPNIYTLSPFNYDAVLTAAGVAST